MKILEIIATKRTGQHAIISWIVKNLTDMNLTLKNDKGSIKMEYINDKVIYWNDTNNDQDFGMKLFQESHLYGKLQNLIVNYEDVNVNYSFFSTNEIYKGSLSYNRFENIDVEYGKRLILIRDFYNCLASRYKQRKDSIFSHDVGQNFINLWKDNAKFVIKNPKMSLKYEDWLNDDEKRKQILFDFFNIEERHTPNKINGRESSFDDKNYNKRFEEVDIPEETKELIRKDSELHYLIGKLGYDYKNI